MNDIRTKRIDVSIVGATGYTGLELIKILFNHPKFNIVYIANSTGDTTIDKLHPSLIDVIDMKVEKAIFRFFLYSDNNKRFLPETLINIEPNTFLERVTKEDIINFFIKKRSAM